VLLYYGITGAAALAIPREQSLFHPWVGVMGLVGCVSLAFFIDLLAVWGGIRNLGLRISLVLCSVQGLRN